MFGIGKLRGFDLGKRLLSSIWSRIRCRRKKSRTKQEKIEEPYQLYERLPTWYELYVEFTNRTTWHGLKYPCLPSRFKCRSIIWVILLLSNAALFLYIMTLNMIKLKDYPSQVNVEVDYINQLPFPAITICNQNMYRLTAMQEHGLYDYLVDEIGNSSSAPSYCDTFQLFPGICRIPDSFYPSTDSAGNVVFYGEMTRHSCLSLCVNVNDETCSSVLYNRENRTCEISPYTGEWYESWQPSCNSSQGLEFYRRIRCDTNVTVHCDFENGYCPLKNDTSEKDQWMIVEAEGHPAYTDNTLNLGSGHILNLLTTANRPGYKARVKSSYMNTTNKCLELFYWLQRGDQGNSESPTLSVIAVTEERVEQVASVTMTGPKDWSRLLVPLPDGINEVVIEGKRGSFGMSGISVDDISILDCDYFSSHRECKVTRLGKGYMGTQSVTVTGKPCLPWDTISIPLVSRLPDLSAKAAGSHCRNIPQENWTNPSCFIELKSGNIQLEPCDIPYCDCLNSSYFRCGNGMCLPSNLLCNGVNECLDNSDELQACTSRRTVDCAFNDDYKCGYTVTSIGDQVWIRQSSGSLSYNLVSTTVSALEQLMVVDSKLGQFGDKVQLISPMWTFTQPTSIELTYIMLTSTEARSVAGLYMYQMSDLHAPIRLLFQATSFTDTDLHKSTVSVPNGTYHLMFLGVQGVPYESVFGLDIVATKTSCNETFDKIDDESINCTFVGFCGYRFLSNSALFSSALTNYKNAFRDNIQSTSDKCSSEVNEIEGTILSPGYPGNYPNDLTNCSYLITQPTGTTISITFVEFNVEAENDCLWDRLEITDVDFGKTRIYCGNNIPPTYKSQGHIVLLVFKTDDTVNNGRFKLVYTTDFFSTSADSYIAVMKYSGPPPSNFFSYSAKLISPPIVISSNSCLSLTIVANANITIRRSFLNDVQAYVENPLFSSGLDLGQAWHRLYVDLEPLPNQEKFAVVLESAIGSYGIVATAITDITLYNGTCRKLITNGSLDCNFIEIHQCGYLDDSSGAVNWARVYDKISDQYYMRAVFTKTARDEAVLRSVQTRVNTTSCLRVNVYTTSTILYVAISRQLSDSSIVNSLDSYRLPIGNVHLYYALPAGTYSIGIGVSYPTEVLEDSVQEFNEVRIYGTIVTEGSCLSTVYMSNATCDFDEDFICDYQPVTSFADPWNWVNFKTFLELDMKLNSGDAMNTSAAHGNVMLFNGSINWRKGVLISPVTKIRSPGQTLSFSAFASANKSTYLEIMSTNALDHVTAKLFTTKALLKNEWKKFKVCLPPGSYRVVFVAYTTVGDYVAIDDVVVNGISCSASVESLPISDNDCTGHNLLHCQSFNFLWSPKFDWQNISDIRPQIINPAGNECVHVFNALKGNFTYDENVKTSSNASECDLYIRGNGQFTAMINITDSALNCSRQYFKIWRYENGTQTDDNRIYCNEYSEVDALLLINVTTENILQINVHAVDGNPRFTIHYTFEPVSLKGYSLALYYRSRTATQDVTVSRFAEWATPLIQSKLNDTVCLIADMALGRHSTLEIVQKEMHADTRLAQYVVLTAYGDQESRGEPLWKTAVLEIPMDPQTSLTQFIFYFSVSNATLVRGTGQAFIGAIRNVTIFNGSCISPSDKTSVGACSFGAHDSCNFVDSSLNTSRWLIASEVATVETSGYCKITFVNDYDYTGNVTETISGRTCQRWDSQTPQAHLQDLPDYFPDPSLNYTANHCRNPNNPFIARTAWCYTTDPCQRREYCDIPYCLNHFMKVDFSSRISSRAILKSPRVYLDSPACLRFRYRLTSTRVQLTVIIVADTDDDQQTFTINSDPTNVVWLTGELELAPSSLQIHFCADKIDVTDNRAYVAIDNVTIAEGHCHQAEGDNTSISSARVPYEGPRLPFSNYVNYVLKDMQGVDMRNITSILAHQMDQLVHQCDYVVDDCLGEDNFKTEFTDLGQCYTFNFNQSTTYVTNASGASSGLRLILNIEQYEHVPEFGLGVGVKLHLHDQIEIPSMKNLGISIPTAMNTLAAITYTRTEDMLPPFGSCGAPNLTFYDNFNPDNDYTEAKCQLQDKTEYYDAMCNCKDIYMPGPANVCTFPSYFECVYTSIQDHLVPYASSCPPACIINSFSVETSQAQLPGLDINKLYANKADDIQRRYLHALEIRNRVDETLITSTIGQLKTIIDAENRLKDFVYFSALDPATSYPALVQAAMTHSGQLFNDDIITDGTNLLEKFQNEYAANLRPSVSYLVRGVQSLYAQLSFGKDVLLNINNPGWSRPQSWYEQFVNDTWSALMLMNDSLTVFAPKVNPNDVHLPQLFAADPCQTGLASLISSVSVFIQEFNDFPSALDLTPGSLGINETISLLISRIGATLVELALVENCTQQYEKLLDDFDAWLRQLDFSFGNTTQTKADEILVMFNDIGQWLIELRDNYSQNTMTKEDLATGFTTQSANAIQQINNAILEINQQVVTPMQNRIDNDLNLAATSYFQYMKYLARLYNFTMNKEIDTAARLLTIWREPVHNLELPQTIQFHLDEDEVWQVWSTAEDLPTFVAQDADNRLVLICTDYFDPLHRKLGFFLSEMNNRLSQLVDAVTSLQNTLQNYLDSTALGETFAMTNFLVLDIYYGELKYQHITVSTSYTWQNFFSDMGSFFGLLMGCSILTMVEVIDLVLYYSIVKLIERYEERPLRQEVIDIKI